MKRFAIIVILLMIFALFLYAAYLDGLVAFAEEPECEFCEFLSTHDFEEDSRLFATNIQLHPMFELEYQFQFVARATHGAKGKARYSFALVKGGIPINYCPECGKRLENDSR